ncbi:hypothetical protein, partial [Exiguobacterium sp. s152]|uniref:hypothetical protein n=1 Tax=Exiguobacterium sp. s152 TaxID=2751226 RepID=UPI001BEBA5E7
MTDANFPDSYISEIEDFFEKRILNNVHLNRHYHGDFINMYLDFPSDVFCNTNVHNNATKSTELCQLGFSVSTTHA